MADRKYISEAHGELPSSLKPCIIAYTVADRRRVHPSTRWCTILSGGEGVNFGVIPFSKARRQRLSWVSVENLQVNVQLGRLES